MDICAMPRDTEERERNKKEYARAMEMLLVGGYELRSIRSIEWVATKYNNRNESQMFSAGAEVGELKRVRCTDALPRVFMFG